MSKLSGAEVRHHRSVTTPTLLDEIRNAVRDTAEQELLGRGSPRQVADGAGQEWIPALCGPSAVLAPEPPPRPPPRAGSA
jgi:hypothetical protein